MDMGYLLTWAYYRGLLSGKTSFRSFLLIFCISLVSSVIFSFSFLSEVRPMLADLPRKLVTFITEVYPEELELYIQDGIASTNVSEPYVLNVSSDIWERVFLSKRPEYQPSEIKLIAIDTKGSVDAFSDYGTFGLLTGKYFVYRNDEKIEMRALSDIPNTTVTQRVLVNFVESFAEKISLQTWVNVFVFVIPLLMFILMGCVLLASLFFYTCMTYCISYITQSPVMFGSAWKYTAALATLPFIASYFFGRIFHTVEAMLVIGLCYEGIRQGLPKAKNHQFSSQIWIQTIITILIAPFFLFLDLFASRRSVSKKLAWGVLVFYLGYKYWLGTGYSLISSL